MRSWSYVGLVCGALLLSACADVNEPSIPYPNISTTAISPTTVSISWHEATDGRTPPSAMVYRVYLSTANPAYQSFNSFGVVEAGTLVTTLHGTTNTTVSGLSPGSSYYINIVVQDEAGNKSIYHPLGEYFHNSLIAYYPFSGNGNDATTTANHLALATGTSAATLTLPVLALDRFNNISSAYNFSPTATSMPCLQSTNNVGISGNASRTVSLWLKSSNTPAGTTRVPFAWGNGSANGSNFGLSETGIGNNLTVWLWGAADISTGTAVTNAWEHWVVGYDSASNLVYTYKNGSVVNNGTLPAVVANTVDGLLYVGCGMDPTGTLDHPYQGTVDDLRIFNVLLSSADVALLYNATRP